MSSSKLPASTFSVVALLFASVAIAQNAVPPLIRRAPGQGRLRPHR